MEITYKQIIEIIEDRTIPLHQISDVSKNISNRNAYIFIHEDVLEFEIDNSILDYAVCLNKRSRIHHKRRTSKHVINITDIDGDHITLVFNNCININIILKNKSTVYNNSSLISMINAL